MVDQKRFKLVVAYDGTSYFGWQMQANRRSVEQALRDAIEKVFGCKPRMVGASRTDAGVHALGQVVLCTLPFELSVSKFKFAVSNALPRDIILRRVEHIDASFHPHHNVARKIYYYHFFNKRPLPFVERYGWFYRYPLDLEKLVATLRLFEGTHDFRSFCTGNDHTDGTVRTIEHISFEYIKRFGVYRIGFTAPRFMRYMIRRLVGAAIAAAGSKKYSPEHVQSLLTACNPHHTLPTAPAQGLMLYKIVYNTPEAHVPVPEIDQILPEDDE